MPKQFFGSLTVRLAVSTVAAGLFVGCEKSETKPASTDAARSAASDASKSASDAAKSAGDAAASAGEAAKSTAGAASEQAGAAASNASATVAGDSATAPAAPADAAPADAATAPAAAADAKAQATDLLTKVSTYVKENKMDLAEKALAQLDKLKPQLPADYQSKIDTAHTMFDAAKKGQGLGDLKNSVLGK
jgi:hypothetical protein